ncbi:MAG TPA: ATP-binding protein [Trichormus sp.]
MISRLNLTWRGILMVAFPLACQLVFLVVLGSLLSRLYADMIAENGSRSLISDTGRLLDDCMEFYSMPQNRSGSDPLALRLQNETLLEVLQFRNRFNSIVDRLPASPDEQKVVGQLKQYWQGLILLTQWGNQERRLGWQHWEDGAGRAYNKKSIIIGTHMMDGMQELMVIENRRRLSGPAHSKNLYASVVASIVAAVVASLALAIFLAYLYAVCIKKPLLRIAENSRLLSYHQQLLPELTGIDELSSLDRLLHTVSRQMEEVLQRELSLIGNAGDLICSLTEDGVFKVVNPAAQKLLGWNPEDMVGKALHDLVPVEDGLICDEHIRRSSSSTETHEFDLRLIRADGTIVDTRWICFWSDTENSLFCVAHDITEQKRIDSLKQDFVDMISHDLRSPLTSMFGSMNLIASGAAGEVSREILDESNRAGKNIEVLINFVNDLLDFQKLESGRIQLELSENDLSQCIREAAQMVAGFAESTQVSMSLPEGNWNVSCDHQKIIQTLVNLLSNAIKFNPSGGTVSARVIDDSQDFVEIDVIDEGPGVPADYRERIFEAFEQVPKSSRSKGGTGLGLAICKLIVAAHGGSIGVSPATVSDDGEEKGSIFWVRLPKVPGAAENVPSKTQVSDACKERGT